MVESWVAIKPIVQSCLAATIANISIEYHGKHFICKFIVPAITPQECKNLYSHGADIINGINIKPFDDNLFIVSFFFTEMH